MRMNASQQTPTKLLGRITRSCLPSSWRWVPLVIAAMWVSAPSLGADGQSSAVIVSVQAEHAGWSVAASMMTARSYLAAARAPDGTIYAIGGYDSHGRPLRTVEAYNPRSNVWSARAPMPTARAASAAVTGSNGTIYVLGGLDAGRHPLASVEAYDPRTNIWHARAPMPTARGDLSAVAPRGGKIYAIGGWKGNGPALGTVEAYNPATNAWSSRASLPLPELPFPKHDLAATVAPDGKIYALAWGDVETYDPTTNVWQLLSPSPGQLDEVIALAAVTGPDGTIYAIGGHTSPEEHGPGALPSVVDTVASYHRGSVSWTFRPPMLTARYALAAVVGGNGNIYVFGGRNRQNQTLRTVEIYNPKRDPWTTAASMPRVTWIGEDQDIGPSAAVARGTDGNIYVLLGGADESGNATTVVQAYAPKSNSWTTRAPLPGPVNFMPLGLFAAAAGADGKIYVVGGDKGDRVEAYDPGLNRWSAQAPIPIQLWSLQVTVGLDGKIYAIGYSTPSRPTVAAYDPVSDTWTRKARLPTSGFRPFAAATGLDGKIYVFGRQTVPDYARTVETYDPGSNSWATRGPMPDLGGIQAAVTGSDGKIYVVGGGLSDVVPLAAYLPRLNRWSMQAPAPSSRYNLAAAAGSNGRIYIAGGSYHGSDQPVHQVDVFTISKSHAERRTRLVRP
jgi:N-acetylneuraminic acid mutarotase